MVVCWGWGGVATWGQAGRETVGERGEDIGRRVTRGKLGDAACTNPGNVQQGGGGSERKRSRHCLGVNHRAARGREEPIVDNTGSHCKLERAPTWVAQAVITGETERR
jgi:hypothetical protein